MNVVSDINTVSGHLTHSPVRCRAALLISDLSVSILWLRAFWGWFVTVFKTKSHITDTTTRNQSEVALGPIKKTERGSVV